MCKCKKTEKPSKGMKTSDKFLLAFFILGVIHIATNKVSVRIHNQNQN